MTKQQKGKTMSRRKKYRVNWSDPSFPCIEVADPDDLDPQTLAEAKEEIEDHFRGVISHARSQLDLLKKVRTANLDEIYGE